MGRKGARKRIARNIYADSTGRAAIVRVGPWRKERRFPPHTPIAVIRQWQEEQRRRFQGISPRAAAPTRGTFAADVEAYLLKVRHLAGWVSLRSELRRWCEALPANLPRYAIDVNVVTEVRNRWLEAGASPKTCNNRLAALARLWHSLDGPRSWCPCDDVAPLALHKTPPSVVPPSLVLDVYQRLVAMENEGLLRHAKTRARFMLMASTGKRPSEIMRAKPGDVDLERRVWIVRDGKGGWSPGVYLNDDMLAAWKVFIAADAWGRFREGALVRTLRAAGWPCVEDARGHVRATPRPYQLRHSVGILMSEGGVDLADIQQHMGHKRIETTRKHYVPVLGSRLQAASELIDGRFRWPDDAGGGTGGTAIPPAAASSSSDDGPE